MDRYQMIDFVMSMDWIARDRQSSHLFFAIFRGAWPKNQKLHEVCSVYVYYNTYLATGGSRSPPPGPRPEAAESGAEVVWRKRNGGGGLLFQ